MGIILAGMVVVAIAAAAAYAVIAALEMAKARRRAEWQAGLTASMDGPAGTVILARDVNAVATAVLDRLADGRLSASWDANGRAILVRN